MKYKCSKCGQEHEGRPSIAFDSPDYYDSLNEEDKKSIATLSDDLCVIRHEDQTDRFIRAVLHQKVNDDCQTLDYGVWVSLSEKSFKDYVDNFDNEDHNATYFGFLSNNLTGYKNTLTLRTNVVLRGKIRPEVIPHDDQFDNDFVRDYYEGIDKETADERINRVLTK
jgi:hypothetical protein